MRTPATSTESKRQANKRPKPRTCYVGATLFTSDPQALEERKRAWQEWSLLAGESMLRNEFGIMRGTFVGHEQGLKMTLNRRSRTGESSALITFRFDDLVPKGIAVRLHIFWILLEIDNDGGYPLRDDAIYAFVDGSGAFEFDSLRLVLRTLLADEEVDVCFGTRPENQFGISEWRKAVEEFEHYILLHHFEDRLRRSYPKVGSASRVLPDGQAGCWAFRARAAKDLALTARGYEIELDLLFSAVLAGLRIEFSEPLLMSSKTRVSDFSSAGATEPSTNELKACCDKLEFIQHKLNLDSGAIADAKAAFISNFADVSRKVPRQYWSLVDSIA
jgi:hypothetical protein